MIFFSYFIKANFEGHKRESILRRARALLQLVATVLGEAIELDFFPRGA